MGTCFPASLVTAADRLHEWRLQWTLPAPWSCADAQSTIILGRHQRLLLELSVMKENVPQINIFQVLVCAQAPPQSASVPMHLPHQRLEKLSNTVHADLRTRGRVPVLSKQPWKWKMLQLCALSQQALMTLRHTDTKP